MASASFPLYKEPPRKALAGIMELSDGEFPADIPMKYKKCYEDLHEFLNKIVLTLSKVEDKTWKRKLAGFCIFVLGATEFPEMNLTKATEDEKENYIG